MFKTTFRYLISHKIFSVINLSGMAIGLMVCYFAMRYVAFELSYDSFNTKANRIYRVVTDVKTPAGVQYESAAAALAPELKTEFPEVKEASRIFLDDYILQKGSTSFGTVQLAYADASLFKVLTLPLLRGTPETAFNAPFDMVLSESAAGKYFGTTDCIGKTLTLNGNQPARITAVMQDMPYNAHLRTDIFLSLSSLIGESTDSNWMRNWNRFGFYTFVLLNEKAGAGRLQKKLPAFLKKYAGEKGITQTLSLEPLTDVYLKGKARGGKGGSSSHGSMANVYIFSVVAVFVLVIACFNFINLTTAFSLQRSKEIGLRKVLGASRAQLVRQFLTDALVLCLLAFLASIALCFFLTPAFQQLTGKIIDEGQSLSRPFVAILFALTLVIGLLSGLYPALFMSAFKPLNTLKGEVRTGGFSMRKGLVIAQFSMSIVLMVCTIVVYSQLHYMQTQDLGFKKDHLLVVDFQYDKRILDHRDAVVQELKKVPGVTLASYTAYLPGKPNKKFVLQVEHPNGRPGELNSDAYFIDENFIPQYGLRMAAGRAFSNRFASDSASAMIVNEAAVRALGYRNPAEIIGKRFSQMEIRRASEGQIVGVVKDFHFQSYQQQIEPMVMRIAPGFFTYLTLTVSSDDLPATLSGIEKTWSKLAPGLPFSYFFSDETYDAQYKSEARFGSLFTCFATLAIFISCLGLFGLSAFATTQRTKEIGIRKVLGASIASVLNLLTGDFLKLILAAFFIALPVAWLAMSHWLQNFAYRISISWWMFALAGIAAVVVALFTVSFHALKSALANPAKSLRSE